MRIVAGEQTSAGQVRKTNEDNFFSHPAAGLFVVADGMGGHDDGEVASEIVIDTFEEAAKRGITAKAEDFLTEAILAANETITSQNAQKEAPHRRSATSHMGTTVVAALLQDGVMTYGHLGDSRLYVCRSGELTQLTRDHTLAQKYAEIGMSVPAHFAQASGLLMRAVGLEKNPPVSIGTFPAQVGDVFLLCSDGLTNEVSHPEIARLLQSGEKTQQIAESLVAAANKNGGKDNITVIVVKIL